MNLWSRIARAFVAACFAAALCYEAIAFFQFPRDLSAKSTFAFEALILVSAAVVTLLPARPLPVSRRLALGAFIFAFTALVPFAFSQSAFGTHDIQSLLITARENRLGEMATVGFGSFRGRIAEQGLALLLAITGAIALARRVRWTTPILYLLAAGLLLVNPVSAYLFRLLVPNPAYARLLPERTILPPDITARPARPMNLVIVYMESIERTYRDIPETAAAFAPLARIEDRAVSARNIAQLDETGFTAGGLVATQCGVPLYPRGVFHVRTKSRATADAKVDFADFLEPVTCLGDILAADGYTGSYMNGSDLEVFSKGEFFRSHGYTRFFGRGTDPAYAADPRMNLWGLNDEVLFEAARKELATLARGDKPFVLSLLTVSTHGPDALLDDSCTFPVTEHSGLPAAINCTGLEIETLIDEVTRLGIADTTVIAVMSDHLAMKNTLEPEIAAYVDSGGQRRNFVSLIIPGSPGTIIDRPGTMIDVFPTLLDALGYDFSNNRANMGISLLSDAPTLSARMGLDALNASVNGNFHLQSYLWDGTPSFTVGLATAP